ncbi:Uncharacterized protein Rs2_38124 [Raphanus sativus]|nr:Uncharacterized protein Rs2_38124 [Raphanus sativus]
MFISFFVSGGASSFDGRPALTPAWCLVFSGERPASASASYGTCVSTAASVLRLSGFRLMTLVSMVASLPDEFSILDVCSPVKEASTMAMVTQAALDEISGMFSMKLSVQWSLGGMGEATAGTGVSRRNQWWFASSPVM